MVTRRVLVVSDEPRTQAHARLALGLIGVEPVMVRTLHRAESALNDDEYEAVLVDLRWEDRGAPAMTAWIREKLLPRRVRIVLGEMTPLGRDLSLAMVLKRVTFLRANFDLLDLQEAVAPAARVA